MAKKDEVPQAVQDAAANLVARLAEEDAAHEAMIAAQAAHSTAGEAWDAARKAFYYARHEADGELPMCRMTSKQPGRNPLHREMVIVRQTPSGTLTLRERGSPQDTTDVVKFEWSKTTLAFYKKGKPQGRRWYHAETYELTDVPAVYIP